MFNLKQPCVECPFVKGSMTNQSLSENRMKDIVNDILVKDLSFQCHKTIKLSLDKHEHCAGAILYLERENKPNQIMRIAERIGRYNKTEMKECPNLIDRIHN